MIIDLGRERHRHDTDRAHEEYARLMADCIRAWEDQVELYKWFVDGYLDAVLRALYTYRVGLRFR